jgi:hypothetical protein
MTNETGEQVTLDAMDDETTDTETPDHDDGTADGEQSDAPDVDADSSIEELLEAKFADLDSTDEQVEFLNRAREKLHDVSPFEEPIDCVQWVKHEQVEGNDYNPNEVATPEMDLLHKSIKQDGYTQPIVTYEETPGDFEVVDGFHRTLVGKEKDDIRERLNGYVPVTTIDKDRSDRMSSTIRHNRARGTHQIRDMSTLVAELYERGWSDERICAELGMELDEVIRLKQVSGLKDVFSDHEFSQSWTEYEDRHESEEDEESDVE